MAYFLLIIINTIIATVSAADFAPQAMKPPIKLDLYEIAQKYKTLAQPPTAILVRDQKTQFLPRDNFIGSDFGHALSPQEFNDSFNTVEECNLSYWPAGTQKLFKTLKDAAFFTTIGRIYPYQIQESSHLNPERKKYKSSLNSKGIKFEESKKSIENLIIPNSTTKNNLFHQHYNGIFFRNKNHPLAILQNESNKEISYLFQESDNLKAITQEIHKINLIISVKLQSIENAIQANQTDQELLASLRACPDTPPLFLNKIESQLNTKTPKTESIVTTVKDQIKILQEIQKDRSKAEQVLFSAPIDLFLLYSFYLMEGENRNLFPFDLLNSFEDIDDLSKSQILADNAMNVMDILGISLLETAKKTAASTKNTKQKPKKKNRKPKAKKATKNSSAQSLHDEENEDDEIELCDDEHNENDENHHQRTDVTVQSTSYLSAILKGSSSTSIPQIEQPQRYTSTNSKGLRNSLSDPSLPQNFTLKLNKEFRILDTLARLLARELALGMHSKAGAVSIAYTPENGGSLIVATKNNRKKSDVITGLKNVFIYSNNYYQSVYDTPSFLKERTSTITQIVNAIDSDSLYNESNYKIWHNSRSQIDKIKLIEAINNPHGEIVKFLHTIAKSIDSNRIILLENPLDMHAELLIAEYLITNKKTGLGIIKNTTGASAPYQYIGNSILNCGKCNVLLRGGDNIVGINANYKAHNLVLFTRGHYNSGYPSYVIPKIVIDLEKQPLSIIRSRLDTITFPSSTLQQPLLNKIQQAELSDSDDEE